MQEIALLISPEAKSAYFKDYIEVAQQELKQVLGDLSPVHRRVGTLDFFHITCDEAALRYLPRLSFVQGLFDIEGEQLRPLELSADFALHDDFVFAPKYRGKTNERLTQMLINVGLSTIGAHSGEGLKLLDPMCGRATTLLWSLRYGFDARGIEQETKVLDELTRTLKSYCKQHRQKHRLSEGFIGKANKDNSGKFLEFSADGRTLKVITGDSRFAHKLLKGEKFDLLISDLPYGVQHFTTSGTRNPLPVLRACAAQWKQCLKPGGAVVLAFNRYLPRRQKLVDAFAEVELEVQEYCVPHRMSESIVRDVAVFKASTQETQSNDSGV